MPRYPKQNNEYYRVGRSPFVYAGYQCNNRCVFCFEAGRKFPKKTTEQLKKEIRIIRQNFDLINFMGQEPTLREDIVELIAYAKTLDFKEVGLTTNGRMFAYIDFTKRMLASGLTQIVVTMIGHLPQIHDSLTLTKGSFKQALAGLKNILWHKSNNLSLIVNIMVTRQNFKDLLRAVDFYADLGVKEINIGHVMPLNKMVVNSKTIIAPMKEVTPYLVKAYKKYASQIKFLFVEYPACSLPEKYRFLAFPCLEENPQKKRIKLCKKCPYQEKCTGISKDYLNLYGDKEFKL